MGVYQSTTSRLWCRDEAEAEAAREILASHVPDPESNLCVVCLVPGPCRPANAAANRLVDLGRPVLPPDEPRRRRTGWRGWLGPQRRAMSRRTPLLTFAWMLRLGVPAAGSDAWVAL
ncbi:hypothetical protein GA0074695_0229 [Micromonospora viridifaciens]|uniref:Uncharacterized protein n=1 Tax=Micromonospora viridifaciens TaxID=1881 RepID=A0A1C4U7I7_MICVI|nr:hypothetical protein [Micromonospora viridifaciens]SCE67602.1 hypothetical protein GA0074695_0229 [Micromonospora viridifaciens]